jgi:argininosuccinate lyase
MEINSDFRELLRTFVDGGVRFLIVGAYAVMHHTAPRYTKDLDLWVEPTTANATRVLRALTAFGAPVGALTVDDLAPPDVVCQIGVAPVRVDILTGVSGLSFRAAYGHAV